MIEDERLAARLLARALSRAVPVRETYTMAPDPDEVFGVVTIKVVTEDQVQALAFGQLGGPPTVIPRWNPLSRDTSDLQPFALALTDYVDRMLATRQTPRICLPHGGTLDVLDIMGWRYQTNPAASDAVRRLGRYCRAVAEEARYADQQVVFVAGELLADHVATGQSPTEDRHPGALLAWVDTSHGRDPRKVARERSLYPASGILVNTPDQPHDDIVEGLRQVAKNGPLYRRTPARRRIEDILSAGAIREWELMIQLRNAFWGLGLSHAGTGIDRASTASRRRLESILQLRAIHALRSPTALAKRLVRYEGASSAHEDMVIVNDRLIRGTRMERGRVIDATVVSINQPRLGWRPCTIVLRTPQTALRFRRDSKVKLVGTNITGRIRAFQTDAASGDTLIDIEVVNGVRSTGSIGAGTTTEWVGDNYFPPYWTARMLEEADGRGNWVIDGGGTPGPSPTAGLPDDLYEAAENLRSRP